MKVLALIFSCYFVLFLVHAQVPFERSFGDNTHKRGLTQIFPDNQGGYYIMGLKFENDTTPVGELIRADACNHQNWSRSFMNFPLYSYGIFNNPGVYTSDHNFLIIASGYEATVNGISRLCKIDSNGKIMWSKGYDADTMLFLSCSNTLGGYIVLGSRYNGNPGFSLMKTDVNGNLLFVKKYFNSDVPASYSAKLYTLKNGDFMILYDENKIIRTDRQGNILWAKQIDYPTGLKNIAFRSCVEDGSGNLYFSGIKSSWQSMIAKFSANGNFLWSKGYGNALAADFYFTDGCMIRDQEIVIPGYGLWLTNDPGRYYMYGFLMKADTAGKVIWGTQYNDTFNAFYNINATADGGFLIPATNPAYSHNVIKTNSNGMGPCGFYNINITSVSITPAIKDLNFSVGFGGSGLSVQMALVPEKLNEFSLCGSPVINPDLGPDTGFCFGNTYTIDLRAKNPGCHFLWNTGDTSASHTFSQTGTYWVRVSNSHCTAWDSINLKFITPKRVDLGIDRTICPRDPILLNEKPIPGLTYLWTFPDGSRVKSPSLWTRDSGYYRIKAADLGGCIDMDTIHIAFYPKPRAIAGPDTLLCYNQEYILHGAGGIIYKWIPAKYLSADNIADPVAKLPSTQKYLLIVTDSLGCRDTTALELKVRPPLKLKIITSDTSVCRNTKVKLTADVEGGKVQDRKLYWLDDTLLNDQTAPLTKTGWHRALLRDNCSPDAKDSVFIKVNNNPFAGFIATPDKGCQPLKVNFSVLPDSTFQPAYHWDFGDLTSSSQKEPLHQYLKPGTYPITLEITSASGCKSTKTIQNGVTVFPKPVASFSIRPKKPSIKNPVVTFQNGSSGADYYTWIFDASGTSGNEKSPVFVYGDTGRYTVKLIATNKYQCSDTADETVYIEDIFRIYIPNAFTPNGDTHNEAFEIKCTGVKELNYIIYNRWGEAVFHSSDTQKSWNGTFEDRGGDVLEGIYMYQISITDIDSTPHYYSGTVQLLK
jgi:gliding motility-associated-like protein